MKKLLTHKKIREEQVLIPIQAYCFLICCLTSQRRLIYVMSLQLTSAAMNEFDALVCSLNQELAAAHWEVRLMNPVIRFSFN